MCTSVYLELAVLTVILMSQCHGQGPCPAGWFGPKCKHMCHCNKSQTCDVADGSCPAGERCARKFLGPGCQYFDLQCIMGRRTPSFLHDCDDTTCNPQTSESTVYIEHKNYGIGFVAQFFRVVVNDASKLHQFTLTLNTEACLRDRRYYVSATVVDVHCDNIIPYISVTMSGAAVGALCSINVVAGRNVALKQETYQTSNSPTHPEWGVSSNAVDGNTRNIFDNMSSCSQTAAQPRPTLMIIFDWPVQVTNVWVYNRDVFQQAQEGVVAITNYFGYDERYYSEHRASTTPKPLYELEFHSPFPSTTVNITQSEQSSGEMTLCEVEVYGEVWCEDGMWGLFCDKPCKCFLNQTCSTVTGACSSWCPPPTFGFRCYQRCNRYCVNKCTERYGLCTCVHGVKHPRCAGDCKKGTYGSSCQFNCSKYCTDVCNSANGRCNCMYNRTGVGCTDCPDGKYGDTCQLNCSKYCAGNKCKAVDGSCTCLYNRLGIGCAECPVGLYGEACNFTCSLGCANNVCDSTTGNCTPCVGNYTGDFCTDCLSGTYGNECTFACPLNCADKKCDRTTGKCLSCPEHSTGDNCTVCDKTYYGITCDKKCSAFCLNSLCNATTGICFSCIEGYEGAYCNKEIEEAISPVIAVAVLAPASTLSCVCCFCCGCCICCFATPPEEPEEEEEDDKYTVISTVISAD